MSCPRITGESKKECVHWKTEIQIQISSKSWKAFRFTFTEEAWRDHKCTWEVLTGCSQSLKWELLLISSNLAVDECKWCEHETTYRHISVIACGSSVIPRSLTSSSQSPDPLQKQQFSRRCKKPLPPCWESWHLHDPVSLPRHQCIL